MTQTENPHILIVDEQPRNLDAPEVMFEEMDCTPVRATSADETLLCLLHNEFAARAGHQ
jgi:CheY-like chemotaxis protein